MEGKSIIDRLYMFSFMAVLALLPWSIRGTNYAIALLVLTGLLSTNWSEKIVRLRQHKEVAFFIAFYFLYVLGLFYSDSTALGIKSLEQKSVLVIIPVIVASSVALTVQHRISILRAFVYSNVVFTLTCVVLNMLELRKGGPPSQVNFDPLNLARFDALHSGIEPFWMQFSYIAFTKPIVSTPTIISMYLVLSIFILLTFRLSKLKYVLIAWFAVIILLLASRMGIFILITISLLFFAYDLVKRNFTFRYSLFSIAFVAFICVMIFLFPVTRFRLIEEPLLTPISLPTDANKWNSINLRFLEWKSGLEGIKDNGVTGTGTGGALNALDTYYNQVDLGDFEKQYRAHNQYIETFLEIGLAGIIALLMCLLIPFFRAFKTNDIVLMSVVIMTCLACLSTSLFEKARGLTFYISFVSFFMFTKEKYGYRSEK